MVLLHFGRWRCWALVATKDHSTAFALDLFKCGHTLSIVLSPLGNPPRKYHQRPTPRDVFQIYSSGQQRLTLTITCELNPFSYMKTSGRTDTFTNRPYSGLNGTESLGWVSGCDEFSCFCHPCYPFLGMLTCIYVCSTNWPTYLNMEDSQTWQIFWILSSSMKKNNRNCRDRSVVKSTRCFCIGHIFGSWNLQLPRTPVLWDVMPKSEHWG